ncbi:MAG: DinB family protein [Acidobacteriota bacterium]|nr:DinB family protein [Acidobacteriota bacterium]
MIRKLFAYTRWANTRVLDALSGTEKDAKALMLLAHLLMAEKIWLDRLRGQPTVGTNKSPELSIDECRRLARDNQLGFKEVIARNELDELDSLLTYKNLSGKEFTTSVGDILTHVAIHGAYHRGQIAFTMRSEGGTPVDTDFITFTRL